MSARRFVVQLHDATTLHFDLRLESAVVIWDEGTVEIDGDARPGSDIVTEQPD